MESPGRPTLDADSDGILDSADGCPNQPETVNRVFDVNRYPDQISDIYFALRTASQSSQERHFHHVA